VTQKEQQQQLLLGVALELATESVGTNAVFDNNNNNNEVEVTTGPTTGTTTATSTATTSNTSNINSNVNVHSNPTDSASSPHPEDAEKVSSPQSNTTTLPLVVDDGTTTTTIMPPPEDDHDVVAVTAPPAPVIRESIPLLEEKKHAKPEVEPENTTTSPLVVDDGTTTTTIMSPPEDDHNDVAVTAVAAAAPPPVIRESIPSSEEKEHAEPEVEPDHEVEVERAFSPPEEEDDDDIVEAPPPPLPVSCQTSVPLPGETKRDERQDDGSGSLSIDLRDELHGDREERGSEQTNSDSNSTTANSMITTTATTISPSVVESSKTLPPLRSLPSASLVPERQDPAKDQLSLPSSHGVLPHQGHSASKFKKTVLVAMLCCVAVAGGALGLFEPVGSLLEASRYFTTSTYDDFSNEIQIPVLSAVAAATATVTAKTPIATAKTSIPRDNNGDDSSESPSKKVNGQKGQQRQEQRHQVWDEMIATLL